MQSGSKIYFWRDSAVPELSISPFESQLWSYNYQYGFWTGDVLLLDEFRKPDEGIFEVSFANDKPCFFVLDEAAKLQPFFIYGTGQTWIYEKMFDNADDFGSSQQFHAMAPTSSKIYIAGLNRFDHTVVMFVRDAPL